MNLSVIDKINLRSSLRSEMRLNCRLYWSFVSNPKIRSMCKRDFKESYRLYKRLDMKASFHDMSASIDLIVLELIDLKSGIDFKCQTDCIDSIIELAKETQKCLNT